MGIGKADFNQQLDLWQRSKKWHTVLEETIHGSSPTNPSVLYACFMSMRIKFKFVWYPREGKKNWKITFDCILDRLVILPYFMVMHQPTAILCEFLAIWRPSKKVDSPDILCRVTGQESALCSHVNLLPNCISSSASIQQNLCVWVTMSFISAKENQVFNQAFWYFSFKALRFFFNASPFA